MADVKMTKKDWYAVIREIVEASGSENTEGAVAFIDTQVDALNAKAAKAAEKAAEKRAEGDELREVVYGVVTDEWQTGDQITAQVAATVADVTKAKVVARLSQLVKNQAIEKDYVKDGSRRVIAYRLYSGETDAE